MGLFLRGLKGNYNPILVVLHAICQTQVVSNFCHIKLLIWQNYYTSVILEHLLPRIIFVTLVEHVRGLK
jgi:hypothetical protein